MQATLNAMAAQITGTPTRENDVLSACARGLNAANGISRFWVAKSVWPSLANCVKSTSFKMTKTYDLGWALDPAAAAPDSLCQVKLARPNAQEDQEVLFFLGDLAFAAADKGLNVAVPRAYYALAAVPNARAAGANYWGRLFSLPLTAEYVLTPNTASEDTAFGGAQVLIDTADGRITPATKTQQRKIFGCGTNAKFVGLFHRPGSVTIRLTTATRDTGAGYRLLLVRVDSISLSGATPNDLRDWWP